MANEILRRDEDRITVLGGVTDDSNNFITQLRLDPTTGRLKVSATISIGAVFQPDSFVSTSGQTVFTATKTVAFTIFLSINGLIQTPTTDYTVSGGVATLTNASYPNGLPPNSVVLWVYTTS